MDDNLNMVATQLNQEYNRLAQHYSGLSLPICLWGPDRAKLELWTNKLIACSLSYDPEKLSHEQQQKLTDYVKDTPSNDLVFILSDDPYTLVQQKKLIPALAAQLLTLPLEIL